MKTIAIVATLSLAACSGGSGGNPLDQDWIYTNDATATGFGLNLRGDGTYSATTLTLTSSSSAEAFLETGTFVAANGQLALTPQESTCRGSDPPYNFSYQLQNGTLTVAYQSTVFVMQPDTSTATNFVITLGCFSTTGAFTAQSLAPVGP